MTDQKELTAPIRMYWDVGPARTGEATLLQRICDSIVENKVLSLSLLETGDSLSKDCLVVLRYLSPTPVALSLTISPSALDPRSLELLRGMKLKKLFIRATSAGDLLTMTGLFRHIEAIKLSHGISFEVDSKNYADLPKVLSFCISNGIKDLVLPMQRLADGNDCFMMTADERRVLTAALDRVDARSSLKITIHDPFLWRAFFPAVSFPGRGCQAADTMLYLSPEFDVYPCPLLPVKLGNLSHGSLAEAISSRERREVRKILATPPHECRNCAELVKCVGGCRGRTFTLLGSFHYHDPACK